MHFQIYDKYGNISSNVSEYATLKFTSQKHTYIILTPLNPLLYTKTGV